MDDKLFCFIICSNDKWYTEECLYYISRLNIPEGYRVDVLTVEDARSMTSGYNEAMNASPAKYKVYLHQDVFIVNHNFIQDCLDIFTKHPEVGMIGNVGNALMPKSGIMWDSYRYGKLYETHVYETIMMDIGEETEADRARAYIDVEAIDGLIMITQYDIQWREDLFQKWDFYDVSQSMEFIRHGYKVAVPCMKEPWCVHDCGFLSMDNYENERQKFIAEYGDMMRINRRGENEIPKQPQEGEDKNDHKIEIIVASHNETYWNECLRYIKNLNVPEGYELSWTCITGAKSMTAAYNEGMSRSDAKYKIYVHQYTFLIYPDMLAELLRIFTEQPDVGMIGVIGATKWRKDGIMWNAWNCGWTMGWNSYCELSIGLKRDSERNLSDVVAIDGMFMATQYDIPWREDILEGWDYYDLSQSIEFAQRGYRVVIPDQKSPWCLHDCGLSKLYHYDESRKAFCEAYASQGFLYSQEDSIKIYSEGGFMTKEEQEIRNVLPVLMEQRKLVEVTQLLQKASDAGISFTEGNIAQQLVEIWVAEMDVYNKEIFWEGCADYTELLDRYTEVKFGLQRLEYDIAQQDSRFVCLYREGRLTEECLERMVKNSVYARQKVMDQCRMLKS